MTSRHRPTVGLITCAELPEPDHDQELLLEALAERGLEPRLLAWDDGAQDPATCELCVLRSCWNYPLAPEAFRAWIDRAEGRTCLQNPAPALRWNLHKRYLRELESEGIPVVPTVWVPRGESLDVQALGEERGWEELVLKPAVSAGSFLTRRFRASDSAAGPFMGNLTDRGDAMLQPYLHSVDGHGERALVWIDGRFTHAIRKGTRYHGEEESVSEALALTPGEREFGLRVIERCRRLLGQDLLYARVDVMLSEAGELLLSELELLEPSLFLLQSPAALERLVEAISAHVQRDRAP